MQVYKFMASSRNKEWFSCLIAVGECSERRLKSLAMPGLKCQHEESGLDSIGNGWRAEYYGNRLMGTTFFGSLIWNPLYRM